MLKNMIVKKGDVMSQSVVHSGNAALSPRSSIARPTVFARYICSSTVVDFAAHHEVRIDHLYETFYVLITGLIMFVRTHPDAPEGTIKTSSQAPCISRVTPRNIRSAAPDGSSPIPAWGRTHPRHRPAHSFMPLNFDTLSTGP